MSDTQCAEKKMGLLRRKRSVDLVGKVYNVPPKYIQFELQFAFFLTNMQYWPAGQISRIC